MPLISIHSEESPADYKIGVWRMDESEETLEQMCRDCCVDPKLFDRVEAFKSQQRRLETLATHILLYNLTGRKQLLVSHNDDGRPFIDGLNLSISHTKGYATVIISEHHNVGIDIEYISSRVERIVDWYVRSDEYAATLRDKIVQWCAKETAYKYFSDSKPSFLNLISSYDEHSLERGYFTIKNPEDEQEIRIMVSTNDFFVLTYAVG